MSHHIRSHLVEDRPAPIALPGGPNTLFYTRWNEMQHDNNWARQPWLCLAFTSIIAFRCWHLLTPPSAIWLAGTAVVAVADIAWRRRSKASYSCWREVPAAALRLNAFGPAAAWLLMADLLSDHGAPTSDGGAAQAAAHLARLAFASGAPKMAANALSLRVRLSVSAAVQVALLLASLPYTPALCASVPLAHPAAQRTTHQLHRLLGGLAGMAAAGAPTPTHSDTPLSAADECAVLLTWLRLCISLIGTLLYEAASEARLWQQHAAQRTAAGLPPERCGAVRGASYKFVRWLTWEGPVHAAMVCWLLLALSWHLSSLAAGAL